MDQTNVCLVCSQRFVKKKKGYNRFSVKRITSPTTFQAVFPGATYHEDRSICGKCCITLRSKTVPKVTGNSNVRTLKRQSSMLSDTPTLPFDAPDFIPSNQEFDDDQEIDTKPTLPIDAPDFIPPNQEFDDDQEIDTKPTLRMDAPDFIPPNREFPRADTYQEIPRAFAADSDSFRERAVSYLLNSQYTSCFRTLICNSERAKSAFLEVALTEVKKEVSAVCHSESRLSVPSLQAPMSMDSLKRFEWGEVCSEVKKEAPLLYTCLDSALPGLPQFQKQAQKGQRGSKRQLSHDEAQSRRNMRLGNMLSCIFYSRSPKRFCFPQSTLGVYLWCEGSSRETMTTLQLMGLSQGVKGVRAKVDKLTQEHDREILQWKEMRENAVVCAGLRRHLTFLTNDDMAGFGLCFDNVQFEAKEKHHRKGHKKGSHVYTLMFGIKDRIAPLSLNRQENSEARAGDELDYTAFVPSQEEVFEVRKYLVFLVQRILTDTMPFLHDLRDKVDRHNPHRYSRQMTECSEVVNLGVVNANPCNTGETVKVLDFLRQYVPQKDNGAPVNIATHGDGLSIEYMMKAKKARATFGSMEHDLSCFIESAQEFHKEVINLEDTMRSFMKAPSVTERGTLNEIKTFLNHRHAVQPVNSHFPHVWDLILTTTLGLMALLFMELNRMKTLDDIPESYPRYGLEEDQKFWLTRAAEAVVDRVWVEPSKVDLNHVMKGYKDDTMESSNDSIFCTCNEEKDCPMIRCCNISCPRTWFHYDCVDPPLVEAPNQDWFCSEECQEATGYIYCTCKVQRGGPMIQCHLQDKCKRCEWYHAACIDQDMATLPDNWFCSEQCALDEAEDDGVLNHSRALLWRGLNHLLRRDVVREGNGPMMIKLWKFDLLDFWTNNDSRYFRIGHRLLAYCGGTLPPKQRHQLIWNRVGSLYGGPASNLGIDLINELMNNVFKENVRKSNGMYSDSQIQRHSRMMGPFYEMIREKITQRDAYNHQTTNMERCLTDVKEFVKNYADDGLFTYCPPRHHESFPDIRHKSSTVIKAPHKLGSTLKKLSKNMAKWDRISSKSRNKILEQQDA